MLLRGALSASVCNVEQEQGSHAACIMLSSFVTYDKRSRTKCNFSKPIFLYFVLTTHRKYAFSKTIALWKLPCVVFNELAVHDFTVFNVVSLYV